MAEPTPEMAPLEELLAAALRPVLGEVGITGLRRLTGGASRETWSFDATTTEGHTHPLILRRDPPGRPGPVGSMGRESRCIVAAGEAGLPVPKVLVHSDDVSVLGAAGIVMARVEGEAIARKLLRDDRFEHARTVLVEQCGRALASVHRLDPSVLGAGTPSAFGGDTDDTEAPATAPDPLEELRGALDALGRTTPVFEYALRWLEANRPAPTAARPPPAAHG